MFVSSLVHKGSMYEIIYATNILLLLEVSGHAPNIILRLWLIFLCCTDSGLIRVFLEIN